MELRQLGKSQVKVSPIILGTWAIGGWMWGGTDEKKSIEAIQESIDDGITTIDTAAAYGMGLSEEIVGKAIKGKRDKLVIATKCGLRWDENDLNNPFKSNRDFNKKSSCYSGEMTFLPKASLTNVNKA